MSAENSRPHFLLITTSYPWIADGREAAGGFVADFAAALSDHARVTVVAPGLTARTEQRESVSVRFFSVPTLPLSLMNPLLPTHWPAITRVLTGGEQACAEVVASTQVNHILALWALPCGYWAQRLLRSAGIPYSVWGLGSDIWTLGRTPLVRGVLRRVLQDATHCFADGFALANDMSRIARRPCQFLPSSRAFTTGPIRSRNTKPPYRLAFLGRWHTNKGIDLLIDALGQLTSQDWRGIEAVRIAGGGPLEKQVLSAVKTLRAAGRPVEHHGFLDHAAAVELLDWTDYVLLPSRIESIPVIFSDAMQAARPLICTPVGDLPRLKDKYGVALLAASVSSSAIADAIRRALRDSQIINPLKISEAATDFSVATTAAKFVAMMAACAPCHENPT